MLCFNITLNFLCYYPFYELKKIFKDQFTHESQQKLWSIYYIFVFVGKKSAISLSVYLTTVYLTFYSNLYLMNPVNPETEFSYVLILVFPIAVYIEKGQDRSF